MSQAQKNPLLSLATKSYSTSTGGEPRELMEDLSELPSEYVELVDFTDSESELRSHSFRYISGESFDKYLHSFPFSLEAYFVGILVGPF